MADLVNTGGFRSSLAASSPSLPKLDQIDYDTINKAFAQGWDEGKKLLADLDEFEVRPAKKELQKQALEVEGLKLTNQKKVLKGEQPRFRNDGNFVIDDLTGNATAAPRPVLGSLNAVVDGALVSRGYRVDDKTGARVLTDDIPIMPVDPTSNTQGSQIGAAAPATSAARDYMDFSDIYPTSASTPATGAPQGGALSWRGVDKNGVRLGPAPTQRVSTSASGDGDKVLQFADKEKLKQIDEKAASSVSLEAKAREFAKLNANTSTGPIMGSDPVAWVRIALGNGKLASMDALTNAFTGFMKEGLPGSMSDKEQNIYRRAGPNIKHPPETNLKLITMMLPGVARGREKPAEARKWLDRRGDLVGFDDEWNRYLEEVPTIDAATQEKIDAIDKLGIEGDEKDKLVREALVAVSLPPDYVSFGEYQQVRRTGVIPQEVLSDFSKRLGDLRARSPLSEEQEVGLVTQALRWRYPFLSKSLQERNAFPEAPENYLKSIKAALGGVPAPVTGPNDLNKAVEDSLTPAPAPAPAPAPSGKTIGDILTKDSDPARASRTLPRWIGSADQPLPSEIGGIFFADEETYPEWAEWLGAPAEPFVRGKQGAVSRMLGMPNAEPLTEDVDPKFIDWLAQNKEKVTSDPQFAAKVNQLVRAAVAKYDWKDISKEELKKGRWFDSTTRRTLDPKAARRRRFALQSALFKAGLNGIVRLPAIPGDVDEAPIVDSGPAEPIDDLPVVPVDSVVASR